MKRKSIRHRLYSIFILSVLIPFLVVSVLIVAGFYRNQINTYKENNESLLQTIANYTTSATSSTQRLFLQYLFDLNISKFYFYLNRHDINETKEVLYNYVRYSSKYRAALNNYFTTYGNNIMGIAFIPQKHNNKYAFYMKKYGNVIDQIEIQQESILQELRNLNLNSIMYKKEPINDKDVFYTMRPINRIENVSRQGYIILEVSNQIFRDILGNVSIPQGAAISIYFPDGELGYCTDNSFERNETDLLGKDGIPQNKVFINGKTMRVYSIQDQYSGFSIFYYLPEKILFGTVIQSAKNVIGLWLVTLVAAFVLYIKLSKVISKSTDEIIEGINNLHFENNEFRDNVHKDYSIDEYNLIAGALSESNEKINQLIQEEYVSRMHQQMAEYRAMQAEINPHFFHNVMNLLIALNRIGDTDGLEQGIICLSGMFRYTCESSELSTIGLECDFIRQYLLLEKMRFEERFDYTIELEEGTESFEIPKLLLQPIVENSIQHGMPNDGRKFSILIKTTMCHEVDGTQKLMIMIANDGIPYLEENLWKKGRVGIKNVIDRLSITYPESILWYEHQDNYVTVCNISILKE